MVSDGFFKWTLMGLLALTVLGSCRTAPHRGPERPTDSGVHGPARRLSQSDYEIAPWYGFKTAACSLTFDDGTLDQYLLAYPELEDRDLEATFFLITGPREDGWWDDSGTHRQLLTWDQARELALSGHEIASHTVDHRDLTLKGAPIAKELTGSLDKLHTEIGTARGVALGWPYWRSNGAGRRQARRHYLAARSGGGLSRFLTGQGIPGHTPDDFFQINSLGALLSTTDQEWITVLDETKAKNGWLVAGFHGIDDGWVGRAALGWQAMPIDRFRRVLDYLVAQDKLWIAPFGAVTRYVHERDAAQLLVLDTTLDQMVLRCVDGLDNGIYNHPLTIGVSLPETWETVEVRQSGKTVFVRRDDRERFVFDAMPNGEPITILRSEAKQGPSKTPMATEP